jgi:hypothetical protein
LRGDDANLPRLPGIQSLRHIIDIRDSPVRDGAIEQQRRKIRAGKPGCVPSLA